VAPARPITATGSMKRGEVGGRMSGV
jgi:hypothetical protein